MKARRAGEVPKAPRSLPRVNVAELAQQREVGNACRREHQAEQGGPGELPYGVPAGGQGRLERSEASQQGERSGAEAAEYCCKNRGLSGGGGGRISGKRVNALCVNAFSFEYGQWCALLGWDTLPLPENISNIGLRFRSSQHATI